MKHRDMYQSSFASIGFDVNRRKTRKQEFLETMNRVVP
jgi:hypothetical protein